MTIECYERECKFHLVHTEPDEGPFCPHRECLVTPKGDAILAVNGILQNVYAVTYSRDNVTVSYGRLSHPTHSIIAPLLWWDTKHGSFISNGTQYEWTHPEASQ